MNEMGRVPGGRAGFYVPFLLGDGLLLAAAWMIFQQARRPMVGYEVGALTACVALGTWLASFPFVLRYRAESKLDETRALIGAVDALGNLQDIANRIAQATSQWQAVQEQAGLTAKAASDVAQRMEAEARGFMAFMEKANDAERSHLRLEVDKLRRAENEWLQVVVRMLDHVYALHVAGVRSGQPNLIEQLGNFQNACRDAARRVGLVPHVPAAGSPFDPDLQQLADPDAPAPVPALIDQTLACGYTVQGQWVRKPLVAVAAPRLADADGGGTSPSGAGARA